MRDKHADDVDNAGVEQALTTLLGQAGPAQETNATRLRQDLRFAKVTDRSDLDQSRAPDGDGSEGDGTLARQVTMLALDTTRLPQLTRRQMTVLARLLANESTDSICATLHISERTLENHIAHIGDKLGRRGRRGIRIALRELQALAVVPALVLCGSLSEGLVLLQDVL